MRTKMLLCSATLLLAACAEPKPPNIPEVATAPPVALDSFDAEDTDQEWEARAEARGAARASSDIQSDAEAEAARQRMTGVDTGQ